MSTAKLSIFENMDLKWGIVGCGMISHDFVRCLEKSPYPHKIVAVGDDSLEQAQKFKENLSLDLSTKAYGNYDEFFQDENIDIVYVGIVNFLHHKMVMQALDHGKHVLCEKPMGLNVKQVTEIIEKGREKKLFLMEALVSIFCPAWKEMRRQIDQKVFGDVKTVHANAAVPTFGSNKARFRLNQGFTLLDTGSTPLMDFGIYTVLFALWVFKGEKPRKVYISGEKNEEGVDTWANITFEFSDKRKAVLFYSTEDVVPFSAFVGCECGRFKIDKVFHRAFQFTSIEGNFKTPNPKKVLFDATPKDEEESLYSSKYNFTGSAVLRFEADHVYDCIKEGKVESDLATHDFSIVLAETLQEIRDKLGVVFPCDK